MPLPSTQDLDVRFSVFLNPIRDLTKNWEVDIAKYLEEYLEELSEIRITFDGGETMMNFAEAAMLIQGSATVYCKKVEFLYQIVLQMLDLLASNRKYVSTGDDATDGEPSAGKRKSNVHDESVDFSRRDNIGEGRSIKMKDEDEASQHDSKFAFLPVTHLRLVDKEGEKSKNKINLYLTSKENFGGKDDFRVNRSYMTPWGKLCLDLPPELLINGGVPLAPIMDDFADKTLDDDISSDMLGPLSPPPSSPSPSPPHLDDHPMDCDAVELDATPPPVVTAPAEDVCKAEEEGENKEEREKTPPPVDVRCHGLRTRNAKEQITLIGNIVDHFKPHDPHEQSSPPRPVRAGRIRRPLSCACHKVSNTGTRKRKLAKETRDVLPPIREDILKQCRDLENNNKIVKLDVHGTLNSEIQQEINIRHELLKSNRDRTIPSDDAAQEADAAVGRLNVPGAADANNDDDYGVTGDAADDGFDSPHEAEYGAGGDFDGLQLPDPHTGLPEDGGGDAAGRRDRVNLNDSVQYEPSGEYEALVQKLVAEHIVNAQDYIASSDLTRRVNRWRSRIAPVLTEEDERQAFDIHSYGSKILDRFTDDTTIMPFSDFVTDVPRKEIARIFLSSLMLSNTYNVEPIVSDTSDSGMDCLSLRLLSRVRHHEQMQDFVAPSQTTGPPIRSDQPRQHPRPKPTGGAKGSSRNGRPMTPSSSEVSSDEDERPVITGAEGVIEGVTRLACGGGRAVHKKRRRVAAGGEDR